MQKKITTQQIQSVVLQMEIPGLSNNTTENLKHMMEISPSEIDPLKPVLI